MRSTLLLAAIFISSFVFGQEEELVTPPESPIPDSTRIYRYVEVNPEFPGGRDSLNAFIDRNLIYPAIARELSIEGRVYMQFVVSQSGNISNITITRGIPDCPECDKEAIRLVKSMPKWIPAKKEDKNVHAYMNLPISFTILR
jgi:protein TonB